MGFWKVVGCIAGGVAAVVAAPVVLAAAGSVAAMGAAAAAGAAASAAGAATAAGAAVAGAAGAVAGGTIAAGSAAAGAVASGVTAAGAAATGAAIVTGAAATGMLFTDVEIEGKKQGYKKASNEYDKMFREIQNDYNEAIELIKSLKISYDPQLERHISKLSELEEQEKSLKGRLERKTKDVSIKYEIPIGDVRRAAGAGNLINMNPSVEIWSLIYRHKERKFKEAEQRGYLEAKELYERKIADLKQKLHKQKKDGYLGVNNLLDEISAVLDAIVEKKTKIADLEILLIGDACE